MLEYVASGCSFFRLNYDECYKGTLNKFINRCLDELQDVGEHKFSLLYNGHVEKKFGPMLKNHFRPYGVYADSGGLQIITLGHKITESLMNAVYENQAQYCTVAMSFDEIPVGTFGTRVEKKDMKSRYFDLANFEERAKGSGVNLRRQIEYFIKKKSDAKPLFICHGNGLDTFLRWHDIALKQIPKSLHERIAGIAISGASLGNGTLEDVKRSFYYTQLPLSETTPHLHMLGVGSVQRLIPTLMFMHSGLFGETHVSYDSTSHTSGPHMGRYFSATGWIDYPKIRCPDYDFMHKEIVSNFPWFPHDVETFYESLNTAARTYEKKHGSIDNVIESYIGLISSEIMNFERIVYNVKQKPEKHVAKWCDTLQTSAFLALRNVKTLKDFEHWEQHIGRHLDSNFVPPYKPASLEDLFE